MAPKKTFKETALWGSGFELIKQYGGEEQARLQVPIDIPGSWFGAGDSGALTTAERKDKYEVQAVEFAQVREFKKVGKSKTTKDQAIRFICLSDAADDANHEGFWISLSQWNRYRHDTYKDRRQEELPYILAPTDATTQAAAPAPAAEQKPVGIVSHFQLVSTGPHEVKKKAGGTATQTCTWYRCLQPACKRGKDDLIRETGKSTGQLYREMKKCNHALWVQLSLASPHSRMVNGPDGKAVELMPFSEALPHHVRFVKFCVRDWQPFSRSRSKAFLAYVRGLNPSAGLPHRETSIKILRVMRGLTDQKLEAVLLKHRTKFKEPFAGATSDVWSTPSCRASFFCMRLNLVLEPGAVFRAESGQVQGASLVEAAPMIAFREFKEASHSGKVLAAVKSGAHWDSNP